MPYLALDDLTMYYMTAGEGPPIALLHGAALTVETNWSNQIPVLSRRYKVVAMDLRGHGRTDNPSGILDYQTMAEDVIKLLEKLCFEKTHLIGFNIGGMIAALLALSRPKLVKTLILCSSGYYVPKGCRDLFAKSADPQMIEESSSEWASFHRRVPKEGGSDRWKHLLDQLIKSSEHKIALTTLSRISVPTLIAVGDHNPYGFTRQAIEMHDAIRDSELAVFPNTGHLIPTGKQKLFNETVLDFLSRRGGEEGK